MLSNVESSSGIDGYVFPGSVVTYTLRVTNIGLGAATNVVVYDRLPDYMTVQQTTPPAQMLGQAVQWQIPSVAGQSSQTFVVVVRVANTLPGYTIFSNTGQLYSDQLPRIDSNTTVHVYQP